MEYSSPLDDRSSLARSIRTAVWGKSRPATNWSAALAFCLPTHNVSPGAYQICRIWSAIHRASHREETREVILCLWGQDSVPRKFGLWYAFLETILDLGGVLGELGEVLFETLGIVMTVNQSKSTWMHGARHLIRCHFARKAATSQPAFYPCNPREIDWAIVRKHARAEPTLSTIMARAVNTVDRAARHF